MESRKQATGLTKTMLTSLFNHCFLSASAKMDCTTKFENEWKVLAQGNERNHMWKNSSNDCESIIYNPHDNLTPTKEKYTHKHK